MLVRVAPKIQRNPSNPLSDPGDTEMDVQTTVKRLGPRPSIGRVVSDAVVDDLRSGRALHKGILAWVCYFAWFNNIYLA